MPKITNIVILEEHVFEAYAEQLEFESESTTNIDGWKYTIYWIGVGTNCGIGISEVPRRSYFRFGDWEE